MKLVYGKDELRCREKRRRKAMERKHLRVRNSHTHIVPYKIFRHNLMYFSLLKPVQIILRNDLNKN